MTDAAPDRQHHGGHEEAPIDDGHAVRGAVAANSGMRNQYPLSPLPRS